MNKSRYFTIPTQINPQLRLKEKSINACVLDGFNSLI